MSLHRLTALALAFTLLASVAARADDEDNAPFSSAPNLAQFCASDGSGVPGKDNVCKSGGYDALAEQLARAIGVAASKAPANVRPLLKRDQAFFNEMLVMAGREILTPDGSPEARRQLDNLVRNRIATLPEIGNGFGRSGVLGKWVDAFGGVAVASADGGTYRFEVDMDSLYGPDEEHRWSCRATALLRPDANGWLTGSLLPEPDSMAQHPDASTLKEGDGKPSLPPTIKLRRQGETLRVVAGMAEQSSYVLNLIPHCRSPYQITGSFFASGKAETVAADKIDASLTSPTFDCLHPNTASDEEVCADPDLAEGDQRLNRAWKVLLPRLDEATRRALIDDQRHWVRAQANQYVLSLHPGMAKMTYGMHYTGEGRDGMYRLQRARIALLEGFDENRKGLAGAWLSYTAFLNVTIAADGNLEAKGWKWEQGDWKAGCEYDMSGKAKGAAFRADDGGKNPDTLEREHAMLIVNRLDDAFARGRDGPKAVDEMKCLRSMQASSTARLFPAKASPDIDAFNDTVH